MASDENSTNVHYEVLGQRGTSWTILAVLEDQAAALTKAKEARGNFRAVKVNRERFDSSTNTYRSGQIFFSGQQAKSSKFHSEDSPTVCWRVEDIYSYEGRRAINRLLRKELVEWGLTATELIHSIDQVTRLQDNGTSIQRAVQQTAIAQVRETGQGVQERMKQIYELVDKAVAMLRRDAPKFPDITGDKLDDLITTFQDQESREMMLQGALTKYMADSKSFNEKLSCALGLVRPDHPTWVLIVVDNLVAEILSIGRVLNVLIGEPANLKDELSAVAALSVGRAETLDGPTTPEARMVNRMVAAGKMPATQQALTRFVIDQLVGKSRLIGESIVEEARAMGELVPLLKQPDGQWIGQVAMAEAVSKRCQRWLHPEAIAELLSGMKEVDQKFERLMFMEANVFGNANKRRIGDFLVPIVLSPQGELFLTGEGGTITKRLKRLFAMQEEVLKSELPDSHKEKLAEGLDELSCRILKSARLIERLTEGEGSAVEKCFSLLRMTVEGFFTRGKADTMARHAIRHCLAMPGFAGKFLESVDTREEKIMKLDALTTLLRQAGIDASEALGTGKSAVAG